MKILESGFQRNGVHSTSFYTIKGEHKFDKKKNTFIITFEVDSEDTHIEVSTCRAVQIDDVTKPYRGDDVAWVIQDAFKASKTPNFYDWLVKKDK